MIDRKQLLADLKPLVRQIEADLRARCDEAPQINAELNKEYEQARAADRTGDTFEEWRADLITLVAVAWVLSCVFVRFLEDNALITPPRISGPGAGMQRARDERETYFKTRGHETDRHYLLAVFDELATLAGTRDVFGPHNVALAPRYRDWLSGDAAQTLIEFFQKIDADGSGEIVHEFRDVNWDTRFLGDLYQDVSEAARKKYALLQTPVFVEEFILERTLEPAINEFGLKDFKMIDPACGSGHFLLGTFTHILEHWRVKEPGTNDRELVNRALSAVHGVDLNPYAIAIARFRLLLAAMRECQVTRLKDAPAFAFNLVCGDSLLHGSPGTEQQVLGFHDLAHVYESEDLAELRHILTPGEYHAVVANPPYITVKDKALNQAYRERYPEVCHMKYSLSVPFLQRLFVLACDGGYTGQITANSFMKREFGKKLVESYLPKIDLTHVVDTSGAYIPGHGTPTVILFGRNRRPIAPTIRAVMGIKGEPSTPDDPAQGLVWTAIKKQIDHAGSQSLYVSVNDSLREQFGKHPWSMGGGGAAALKDALDKVVDVEAGFALGKVASSIGITSFTLADDFFFIPFHALMHRRIPRAQIRDMVVGDMIRDWRVANCETVLFPYDSEFEPIAPDPKQTVLRSLWRGRTLLSNNKMFAGKTKTECGLCWYEYGRLTSHKLLTPFSITFANVATHNHFVLDRGGRIFECHAPIIKLTAGASEDTHLALVGLLNSSIACFWMQQTMHNKGGPGGGSSKDEKWHDFFEFSGTQLQTFPVPVGRPLKLSRQLDDLARKFAEHQLSAVLARQVPTAAVLATARRESEAIRGRMISLQEELDWECYGHYGLLDIPLHCANPPPLRLGERAFEIALARRIARGKAESKWFIWLKIPPVTELPHHWPTDYKQMVQARLDLIEGDQNIGLVERPDSKRRWETEVWEEQQERALRGWLLERLERYFDLDGRMNKRNEVTAHGELYKPRLTSVEKVADFARQDEDFMQVAEVFTERQDFDVAALVAELVAAESVPCLPILRYKPAGIDKRKTWERTWELQRLEDEVDALFEITLLKQIDANNAESVLPSLVASLAIKIETHTHVLRELIGAVTYVNDAITQKLNLTNDVILQPIHDAAKRAKQSAIGNIPVPFKYTSADFLSSDFWRLRGKLDVPKERWVSFPHCEGEDGTLIIAWAGYDHLQLARAIAERYELAKEQEGRKLVPLLAAIGQLIPWLKQWHNEMDPVYGARMGDYFEGYLAEEAKALGMSVEKVMAWTPPERVKKAARKKKTKEDMTIVEGAQ